MLILVLCAAALLLVSIGLLIDALGAYKRGRL